jgi:hypothetical protein
MTADDSRPNLQTGGSVPDQNGTRFMTFAWTRARRPYRRAENLEREGLHSQEEPAPIDTLKVSPRARATEPKAMSGRDEISKVSGGMPEGEPLTIAHVHAHMTADDSRPNLQTGGSVPDQNGTRFMTFARTSQASTNR